MYTPVLLYITVLAHACAWEEMINYNRKDSYDTVKLVAATRTPMLK